MSGVPWSEVLDHIAAAFDAGRQQGLAERFEREVDDAVHSELHARACEMLGLARREALEHHGLAWARLIEGQTAA